MNRDDYLASIGAYSAENMEYTPCHYCGQATIPGGHVVNGSFGPAVFGDKCDQEMMLKRIIDLLISTRNEPK